MSVVATMRNPDMGAEPLLAAAAEEGLELRVERLDVCDASSIDSAVARVAAVDHIDVLVNNAGIVGGITSIEEATDATWREVFETNFHGPISLIRSLLPAMRERGSGVIINVSSGGGRIALSPQSVYAPSKWALEAASEILAQEVRRYGIRVAIIEPGVVDTPTFAKNAVGLDPASPYVDFPKRLGRWFAARLKNPTTAEEAAAVIHHAITTDTPRLRYPVGHDAEAMIEARAEMSDQDWIDYGLPLTRDEVDAFFARLGVPIT